MNGLLAIEASQRAISVAIRSADGTLHERAPTGDTRECDLLLPAIVDLCASAGFAQRELTAVAVSTGPGGFTGLRVALATAKGLCEALNIPAIDVASALVAARGARELWLVDGSRSCVLVALASKGDSCWLSLVESNEAGAITLAHESTATACSLEATSAKLEATSARLEATAKLLIADEYLPLALRARAEARGMRVVVPSFHARDCLSVAEQLFGQGKTTDAAGVQVRYPREPEAVTLWRARYPHGFAAKK